MTRRIALHATFLTVLGVAGCATAPPPRDAWLAVDVRRGLAAAPRIEAAPGPHVELVLDATPSMRGRDGTRRTRLDEARGTAAQLLRALPDDATAAIVMVGTAGPACSSPPVRLGPYGGRSDALAARSEAFGSVAEASLADALDRVRADLATEARAGRPHVVVLSDFEDACGGDPCAAIEALLATGASVDLVVLGDSTAPACLFGLAAPAGAPAAIADASATDAVPFRAVAVPGEPERGEVAGVAGAPPVALAPGLVQVELALDPPLSVPVDLAEGQVTRIRVLDFPAARPPTREWRVDVEETPAQGGELPAVSAP